MREQSKDKAEFWLVWRPGSVPTFRHTSRFLAQAEAERLARVNPGERFYVLRAERYSEAPKPVVSVDLEEEMPF